MDPAPCVSEVVWDETALLGHGRRTVPHADAGVDEDHIVVDALRVRQSRLRRQSRETAPPRLTGTEA